MQLTTGPRQNLANSLRNQKIFLQDLNPIFTGWSSGTHPALDTLRHAVSDRLERFVDHQHVVMQSYRTCPPVLHSRVPGRCKTNTSIL